MQKAAFHELEGNLPGEMTIGRAVISMPGTRQEPAAGCFQESCLSLQPSAASSPLCGRDLRDVRAVLMRWWLCWLGVLVLRLFSLVCRCLLMLLAAAWEGVFCSPFSLVGWPNTKQVKHQKLMLGGSEIS